MTYKSLDNLVLFPLYKIYINIYKLPIIYCYNVTKIWNYRNFD